MNIIKYIAGLFFKAFGWFMSLIALVFVSPLLFVIGFPLFIILLLAFSTFVVILLTFLGAVLKLGLVLAVPGFIIFVILRRLGKI